MATQHTSRVAILATDGFEEVELTEPARALSEAGARVDIVSPHGGYIQGVRHDNKTIQMPVNLTIDQANPASYDAVMLPGGAMNADAMRANPQVLEFLRNIADANKPMAVICHAGWELVSAGLARGRTLTSYHTIQDDLRNAGATWVDQEVVVDGNLVTSRKPSDLPAFNREMLKAFRLRPSAAAR